MASTITLANNFPFPGPPVLLSQAQTPALNSPSLAPWLLHTLLCPAGDSCLLPSVLLLAFCPGILPLRASACTFTAGKPLHCSSPAPLTRRAALAPWSGSFLPSSKASVGFQGFAHEQKCSIHAVPLQNASFPSAKLYMKSESREVSISDMKAKNFRNIWRIFGGGDGAVVRSQD